MEFETRGEEGGGGKGGGESASFSFRLVRDSLPSLFCQKYYQELRIGKIHWIFKERNVYFFDDLVCSP